MITKLPKEKDAGTIRQVKKTEMIEFGVDGYK